MAKSCILPLPPWMASTWAVKGTDFCIKAHQYQTARLPAPVFPKVYTGLKSSFETEISLFCNRSQHVLYATAPGGEISKQEDKQLYLGVVGSFAGVCSTQQYKGSFAGAVDRCVVNALAERQYISRRYKDSRADVVG